MKDNFRPSTRTLPSTKFCMIRPACSDARLQMTIYGFAFDEFTKPGSKYHIQIFPARSSLAPTHLPGFKTSTKT